jgi:hypothetical protein
MARSMAQDMTDTAAQTCAGHRLLRRIAHVPRPANRPAPGRLARVSVVIPSYNYGRYLAASVRSALDQRDVEPEVIVVDDASADDSAAIAQRLAAANPRVMVIRHETNRGATATFNAGYAAATGEFIVRLDSDDQLTPGSLARAVALFDAFPGVGLVYGHPVHFTAADPPAARQAVRSWSVWSGTDWIAERCRRAVSCITSQEAVVRASVMRQVGGLSREIKVATDMHFWLKVAAVSDVGRVNGCDQAFHRLHAASITGRPEYSALVDLRERQAVFDDFLAGVGSGVPESAALHAMVCSRLADEALREACRAYDRGRTGAVDVAAFVDFALGVCPGARDLPRWRALQRRRRLGPRLAAAPPFFTASVVARRLSHHAQYRRWQRTGV